MAVHKLLVDDFEDEKGRGQVFLSILDVLKKKKPKAFMLENVKNLVSHDKKKTFKVIIPFVPGKLLHILLNL